MTATSFEILAAMKSPASLRFAAQARGLKNAGADIIDLTLGAPDVPPPASVAGAFTREMLEKANGYTDSRGIAELRGAIAHWNAGRGLVYDAETEVLATPGVKQALYYAFRALLNPGDEVLLAEPFWLGYADALRLVGAVPVSVPLDPSSRYALDAEKFRRAASAKTRMLIFNNPVNPTGRCYLQSEIEPLAEVARERGWWVVSDEIYDGIVFGGRKPGRMSACAGLRERTIVANGFSKTFGLAGWRIGYVLGPAEVISAMHKLQQYIATCPAAVSQWAALAALQAGASHVEKAAALYDARRRAIEQAGACPGWRVMRSEATIYAFIDARSSNTSSDVMADRLLNEAGVAVVPGSAFGASAEGFLRVSLTAPEEELGRAMDRIRKWEGKR